MSYYYEDGKNACHEWIARSVCAHIMKKKLPRPPIPEVEAGTREGSEWRRGWYETLHEFSASRDAMAVEENMPEEVSRENTDSFFKPWKKRD